MSPTLPLLENAPNLGYFCIGGDPTETPFNTDTPRGFLYNCQEKVRDYDASIFLPICVCWYALHLRGNCGHWRSCFAHRLRPCQCGWDVAYLHSRAFYADLRVLRNWGHGALVGNDSGLRIRSETSDLVEDDMACAFGSHWRNRRIRVLLLRVQESAFGDSFCGVGATSTVITLRCDCIVGYPEINLFFSPISGMQVIPAQGPREWMALGIASSI
jgi:hypothetical protein